MLGILNNEAATTIAETQEEKTFRLLVHQAEQLNSIRRMMKFFTIVAVIGLVVGLLLVVTNIH